MDESNPTESPVPLDIFRQVVEQAALAISITDEHAHILYSNPAFQRVTGYGADEITGRNESMLSYKVTPKLVYETMWAQLLRQRPWNGLLVNRRKDGSRYLADLTITPVVGSGDRTTHYLGMHRDVTEVHRLERQVQNQKTMIESVVDAAPVAIVVLDKDERVVLDNQEYKKLIAELGDEPATIVLAALHAGAMGEEFDKAKASGRSIAGREVRHAREGRKTRWFSCSVSWIDEQDSSADGFYEPVRQQFMLLVIQDITALKGQEEAIRVTALRAMLAEQDRIQGLREALSGAAFQLQGPFNMLAAAVRMLERQNGNGDDAVIAGLGEALAAGNRALETLRACIPSQSDEGAGPVDLNAVLTDLLRMMTPRLLTDGVTVEWNPAELPVFTGKQTRLAALFKALLENALDAIREMRGGHRELRVATRVREDRIEVTIENTGPEIPDEWRYKVFEPFFTTKGAERQHIGMGLVVAQEIASDHGGLVELDNLPVGGCVARVQLPIN